MCSQSLCNVCAIFGGPYFQTLTRDPEVTLIFISFAIRFQNRLLQIDVLIFKSRVSQYFGGFTLGVPSADLGIGVGEGVLISLHDISFDRRHGFPSPPLRMVEISGAGFWNFSDIDISALQPWSAVRDTENRV